MQNDSIDNLRLDLNKKSVRGVFYVRVGDTRARTIHITLVSNGTVVDLSDAYICELLIHKPDESENDQAMVRVGNELQYTLRTQDINVPGECKCQVMVTFNDSAVVTSPEFSIMVYQKDVDQELERSTNEYTAISQELADAIALGNQVSQDADRAEAARENIETYEELCRQHEENAAESETNAFNSATSASESADSAAGDKALAKEYRDDAETYMEETRSNLAAVEEKASEILGYDSSAKESAEDAADSAEAAHNSELAALASETAAGNSAEDSEAYAVGTRDSVDVPDTDPAYHNNSKYWSEQSQALGEAQAEEAEAWAKGTKNGTDVPPTAPQYHDNAKYWADQAEAAVSNTVRSFNGRTGAVTPSAGDYDLDDMGDVNLTSPTDGQGLRYDSQSGKWVNGDAASAVSNLTDVDLTNLANGEILKYNSTSQKWENKEDSAGHTIQDASGTALTQRSKMQFKGNLKASDDSTNQRTVVDTKQTFAYGAVGSQSSGVYIATASGYELGEGVLELNFGIAVQATVANGIHINVNNQGAKVFRPLKQLSVGEVAFNIGDFATFIYNRTDDYFTQVKTGHTLLNQNGTALANRDKMQFPDAHLEDDSANTRTKIELVKEVTQAQLENLGSNTDGRYFVDDGEDAEIGPASDEKVEVTADGVKTYAELLEDIRNSSKFDATKLNVNSYIYMENHYYRYYTPVAWSEVFGGYDFYGIAGNATDYEITNLILHPTNGVYSKVVNGTVADVSSYSPASGTKITLYYGNKSAVIDLQTTANRCLLNSGKTVQEVVEKGSVSVTADGVKTAATLLKELYDKIDFTKFNDRSLLKLGDIVIQVSSNYIGEIYFASAVYVSSSSTGTFTLRLTTVAANCRYIYASIASTTSVTNRSNDVIAQGTIYSIVY